MTRSARRSILPGLASLCALAVFFMLSAAPAGAALTHHLLSQITEVPASSGAPLPGPLSGPSAMTVDSGDLWVAEHIEGTGSFRVDEFNASSGAFITQLPQQGPTLDYLDNGVAVGHATGETELYVGVDAYPEGNPEGAVAVFDTSGELQAVWEGADTPGGNFGCFQCGGAGDVAVDNSTSLGDWAAGDVYVSSPLQRVVDVFKPEATGKEKYVTQIAGTSPAEPFSGVEAVAVDEANGEVLVDTGHALDIFKPTVLGEYEFAHQITGTPAGSFAQGGRGIGAVAAAAGEGNGDIYLTTGESVVQFNSEGAYLGQFAGPSESFSPQGVAVDPATGRVYVGEQNVGVDVFSASLVIPDATSEPAINVQTGSATFTGIVNPDGVQVEDCHFDYGTTTDYGHSVPCAQSSAEIGAASSPVAVSADVSGLTAGVVYHFRLSANNANGANTGLDRLVGPPRIDSQTDTGITQAAATLHAQVNPDGVDTTYRFEYGTSTAYGTSVPVPDADIGAGESDEALETELTGLQAGVTYHYRVVAVNTAGTVTGADQRFTTVPPAQIDAVTISDVLGGSASLHAQINPLGTDTTYRFEYGATTSYGAAVPVPDGDLGSGTSDVDVTQHIAGLEPNTTYHVRVVAQNPLGTERSADHTFVYEENGGGLPDNRAYEMVTPPQKNAALIGDVLFGPPPVIAEGGSRIILGSIQCFAGAESCTAARQGIGSPYAFTRTDGGWETTPLAPPASRLETSTWLRYSADEGSALFSAPTPPTGEDDFYARRPDGTFVDVGPLTPPSDGANLGAVQEAFSQTMTATADLSHIVYTQTGPIWPFDASVGSSVMEYIGTGNTAPTLVGVSGGPGSTDLISTCHTELAGFFGALSADGRAVYFTTEPCATGSGANAGHQVPVRELYARIDNGEADAHTVAISQPSALSPSPPNFGCATEACLENTSNVSRFRDPGFQGASADGSKVFFTDTQQLTDAASEDLSTGDSAPGCSSTTGANGCNLYLYDFDNPTGHNLIDVSAGDTSGGGPRVQGVMAISTDGSHVYFVAKGVLSGAANSQGQTALEGADNLYVFAREAGQSRGHLAFIAVLPEADSGQWSQGLGHANVTPDGRYLVLTSSGALTPDTTRTDGAQQVFRYDAQTGELVRISIGERGFNDNGNAGVGNASIVQSIVGYRRAGPGRPDPTMSDDGSRVFFMSSVGLTPGALDSVRIGTDVLGNPAYAQNIYEYHDGNVYLISDGRDTSAEPNELCEAFSAVCLIGTDATGANVFFSTVDPLVPQDTDTQLDIYDARTCSSSDPCIATPPPPLPPCIGEACHGTPAATPLVPSAPTATFSGQGNLTPHSTPAVATKHKKKKASRCAAGKIRRHGKCIKKAKSHKGGKR